MLLRVKWCVLIGFLTLAGAAQATSVQIGLDTTSAQSGNPIGAVVGTVADAGTGETGAQVIGGVGPESVSLNPDLDPAASLSLTIGNIVFEAEDDIDSTTFNDVPALLLDNGGLVALDFVSLFTISGTQANGLQFDESDLAQDTSGLLGAVDHYWLDFLDDGSFLIGLITGFEIVDDPEDGLLLNPLFDKGLLAAGQVIPAAVPEPSSGLLVAAGILAVGAGRRSAIRPLSADRR